MGETFRVNVVHSLKHLLKVVSWDTFTEGTYKYEVKELATCDKFEGNVGNLNFLAVWFYFHSVFIES